MRLKFFTELYKMHGDILNEKKVFTFTLKSIVQDFHYDDPSHPWVSTFLR